MSQYRAAAPIEYSNVRTAFQTARAVSAVLFGLLLVAAKFLELAAPWWIAIGLGAVFVDALARRTHGTTALPSLLLDVTLIGAAFLLAGEAPHAMVAAITYILITSVLLLALNEAAWVIGYLLLWTVLVLAFGALAVPAENQQDVVFDRLATVVFLLLIGALLLTFARALQRVHTKHRDALETERRANELKNEFVSMVSHELRTPLTSIAGFTETLREAWQHLAPEEVEEFLSIMRQETAHLANLVEDILVIPRLEAGRLRLEFTDFDIRDEAYASAERIIPPGGEKEVLVSIPGGVIVSADRVRVRQVLRNLLENARKYGGDQVLIEGEPQGDAYQLSVSDNGPGIPPDAAELVFEQFEQASKGDARTQQGIGLGLPIARRLIRAMGGELWHEARFPTGARFCFTLRIATATPGAAASAQTSRSLDEDAAPVTRP